MAFFPTEPLLRLCEVLGDILVVLAMLAGVTAILALYRRQFGVFRALSAPRL